MCLQEGFVVDNLLHFYTSFGLVMFLEYFHPCIEATWHHVIYFLSFALQANEQDKHEILKYISVKLYSFHNTISDRPRKAHTYHHGKLPH